MKFKCKQSGNVFEFVLEHDIKTMKENPAYEVVLEDKEIAPVVVKKATRPAGRPPKSNSKEE